MVHLRDGVVTSTMATLEKHHLEDNSRTDAQFLSLQIWDCCRNLSHFGSTHIQNTRALFLMASLQHFEPIPIFSSHSDSSLLQTIQVQIFHESGSDLEKNCSRKFVPCRTPTRILVKNWFFAVKTWLETLGVAKVKLLCSVLRLVIFEKQKNDAALGSLATAPKLKPNVYFMGNWYLSSEKTKQMV